MSTRLQDVGLQVWNAALLLCDFICCHGDKFKDATVLELGGGLGLSSIVMAMVAKAVYCTDIRHVLECCERNIIANKGLYGTFKSIVVRELNWLQETLNTDHQNPFHWRKRDIDTLQDSVNVIMAADVIYENDLTDAFFRTIYHIMTTGKSKMLYVSIEKRVNFTIVDLDATAEAYDHFKECLEFLLHLQQKRCYHCSTRDLGSMVAPKTLMSLYLGQGCNLDTDVERTVIQFPQLYRFCMGSCLSSGV
ncbi:methyltransferase-like protein 22 [Saccoglossus kowalevskii]